MLRGFSWLLALSVESVPFLTRLDNGVCAFHGPLILLIHPTK